MGLLAWVEYPLYAYRHAKAIYTVEHRKDCGLILNIIDRRGNVNRWKNIDIIVEPTWHDNAFPNADQAPHDYREPGYWPRKGISLADAVVWASSFAVPLTLYLYDEGSNAVPDLWEPDDENSNWDTAETTRKAPSRP